MERSQEVRSLYLDHARSQLQEQQERLSGFHSRSAIYTTIAIALVGVIAVLLKDFSGNTKDGVEPITALFVGAAAVSFLVTVVSSLIVLFAGGRWSLGPDLDKFMENASHEGVDPVKWTADSITLAIQKNGRTLNLKAILLNVANVTLIVMGCLTILTGLTVA